MAAGFRGVVFDFDFTLADASAGIIPAVNGALGDIGLPQLDEARVRAIIGLSLPAVLEELTGITEPPELVDKFAARFIERADSLEDASGGAALSTVLPGVALALAALRAAGLRIAIASTKGRERIAELLQTHGLYGMFDALVGAEDVPDGRLKPEPDALLEAAVSHANVVPCRLPHAACCLLPYRALQEPTGP
jgi:phosphoglycolate phosphatase